MTEAHPHAQTTADDASAADATPWPRAGFEDRRALAAVRGRLFGNPEVLQIGRYRIDRRVGAGGMGEVYQGFDAELDRMVAIKCVRPELDDALQHQRLRREARALAQLSDPHVVQVYEVGEHVGQTYIAMEYVEGQTLGKWLERPRRWREVVTLFVAAGRGLAAAHSAGVVHRDFKPENVLIGADGRVRVADFGLAISDPITGARATGTSSSTLSTLTENGKMVGTVRYMAYEQMCGTEIGPHTDQFAFCVALYEALWGLPPFALDSIGARLEALEADQPQPPARGLPRRLWAIIRRGLARDPAQRWPSLDALLGALATLPGRRRRLALAALGVGAAALLGGWPLLAREPDSCRALESELAGVWDAERSAKVQAAFELLGAEANFPRIQGALSSWAGAWIDERRAQCDASQAARDDAALTHARRSCLERQRRSVAVLGAALADPTPQLIERAVVLVDELPDPAACAADRVHVDATPRTAAIREQLEALRGQLAELEQLRHLGRGQPAQAQALVESAEALADAALLAEALAEQGRTELAAGSPRRGLELLERAGDQALEAGRDRLVAEIWSELALQQLTEYPDPELGRRHAKLASAQWSRLDPDARARARLSFIAGCVARDEGDTASAIAAYQRALDELGEIQSEARPRYLTHLAQLSAPEQALHLQREALALAEQMWGPTHPDTGSYAFILGLSLYQADHRDLAQPLFDRAIQSWTAAHLEPHPDLARAHELMAVVALAEYRDSRDDPGRRAALQRAQTHAELVALIRAQTLPTIHRGHADAAAQLSRLAALRGDRGTALALALDAIEHYHRALGPDAPELLALRVDVADNELGLGRLERARAGYLEVAAHSAAPAQLAWAQLGLTEVAVRRGQLEQARAHIQAIEALGKDQLGAQILSLTILSAVVDLRDGCHPCTTRARAELGELVAQAGWSDAAIRGWLGELGLRPEEAAALGFE